MKYTLGPERIDSGTTEEPDRRLAPGRETPDTSVIPLERYHEKRDVPYEPRLSCLSRLQLHHPPGARGTQGPAALSGPGLRQAASGAVDPHAIRAALRPETFLVSVMQVNNETRVCQLLDAIADVLAGHDAWFH
ncbi:hypothetical protein [uncultured Thiodictyon sp.]|uniref:hypothetical protein n=1 Tax=uncultured Thiodictyon sp. TaxID=1846217 RepID=UPI0025CD8F67|nr:hypothetical protein [uncultured Thiodictyon sp.]